ncbi:VOC family protein [Actinotalea sp. Marseille-Q4924]|uniref:VOC family protein n=1 Tax=Actinotalea sp. Marseille-Q4924 TaxID=2866571 RepID=UPI001CE49267|nr:VOC family protein [Actinotalea sp. Marseille-Q4924]
MTALTIGMVTFDCQDPRALAAWWADRLEGRVAADHDGEYVIVATPKGPNLGFQRVEHPTPGKNRLHLDLEALDRDDEVERLQLAGAQVVARHEMPDFAWVVLADPEGNHFCVSARG